MREKPHSDATQGLVLRSLRDGVLTLTLNRPERLNALTAALLLDLAEKLAGAANDPDVRVVVLRGAGRSFCSGQDLTDRDPGKWDIPPDLEAFQKNFYHPVVRHLWTMKKPVIAALHGTAAGAGASLVLGCDVVVASENAKLAFSFPKVGLSADAGIGYRLAGAVGAVRARGLLMTGATLDAGQAVDLGLVWRVTPEVEFDKTVADVAGKFASGPTYAYGLIKQTVDAALSLSASGYLPVEAKLQGEAGRTNDYREGVLAFLEKRPPSFSGN